MNFSLELADLDVVRRRVYRRDEVLEKARRVQSATREFLKSLPDEALRQEREDLVDCVAAVLAAVKALSKDQK